MTRAIARLDDPASKEVVPEDDAVRMTRLLAAIEVGDAAYAAGEFEEVPDDRLGEWLAGLRRTAKTRRSA